MNTLFLFTRMFLGVGLGIFLFVIALIILMGVTILKNPHTKELRRKEDFDALD